MKNKYGIRKIFFTFILLSLLFLNFDEIKAVEKNVCEYGDSGITISFDENGSSTIEQGYYEEKKSPWIFNSFFTYDSGSVETIDEGIKSQSFSNLGKCPQTLYVCRYEEFSVNFSFFNFNDDNENITILKRVYIYDTEQTMYKEHPELKDLPNGKEVGGNESFDRIKGWYEKCSNYDVPVLNTITGVACSGASFINTSGHVFTYGEDVYYSKYKNCFTVTSSGSQKVYNLSCPNLSTLYNYIEYALIEYQNCAGNAGCKSQKIAKLNKREDEIKAYCDSILENYNYDGQSQQDCINDCLIISDKILQDKKAYGIINSQNGECGFSTRLASWGLNIMKWVKYVVPVFVIIFGIFDFIKAIGADKEDEMKKSQKKFITRLIAAALIFIIPFILEFVLDKFGFTEYIDGCGVIEEIE